MDVLDELESIAMMPGGGSEVFKKVDKLVDSILSRAQKAEAENTRLQSIIDEANAQGPIFEVGRHGKSGDYFVDELTSKAVIRKGMKLYARPMPAQAIPEGWQEDWEKHVVQIWACARKHDSLIPDDQLDFMRDMLLSASPKP